MASYRACSLPLSRNTAVARFVCTLVRAACGFYNDLFPGWVGLPIAVRWSTALRLVRRCVSAANVVEVRQPIAVAHPYQLGQQHGIAEKDVVRANLWQGRGVTRAGRRIAGVDADWYDGANSGRAARAGCRGFRSSVLLRIAAMRNRGRRLFRSAHITGRRNRLHSTTIEKEKSLSPCPPSSTDTVPASRSQPVRAPRRPCFTEPA